MSSSTESGRQEMSGPRICLGDTQGAEVRYERVARNIKRVRVNIFRGDGRAWREEEKV